MRTPKKAVLKDLLKQAKKKIIKNALDIQQWDFCTGTHLGGGKDECHENWQKKSLGDTWTGYYDDSFWFRSKLTVPEQFANGRVFLNVDFGGELVLRINGELVGSFSSVMNDGWVHRDTFPLQNLEAGQELNLELYGGINTAGFCDNYMAGERSITYTMATARLILRDEATEKFCVLAQTAFDTMELLQDEAIIARLYAAVDDALHMIDFDFTDEVFYASMPDALEFLTAEIAKIPNTAVGEVIMAGHSHIDVAWLWTVKEVERKTERTFSNTLMLMDYDKNYRFTQSQAVLYDFIKKNNPKLYERIREKIKSGQWEVVGNAWVEADTNIASGESLIRQLLYGREFFRKEFGVDSNIYWLPDCFGFTWALPQIIARSGMKYFVTTKLAGNDTNAFPHSLFRWRGPSGHEVLSYFQKTHYQGDYIPSYVKETWDVNVQRGIVDTSFGMYGYGDGGSGGTTTMIDSGYAVRQMPGIPKSRMGRVDEFFPAIEGKYDELPVYRDELYYENHRGTFTTQGFVKKNNRQGEFLLRNIELMTLLSGADYDAEELERVWKLLLINQFHDIMPGTSIPQVYENCRLEYAQMHSAGEALLAKAMDKINAGLGLEKDSYVVWNFDGHNHSGMTAEGFYADNVPAFGYKVFPVDALPEVKPVCVSKNLLENDLLKVVLDDNGEITSIYDKKNDREVLEGTGNRLTIYQDKAVHETAWNLEANHVKKFWHLTKPESVQVIVDDKQGIIEVVRKFNLSTVKQRIVLAPNADYIDFQTEVDWQETLKMLKVEFPVTVIAREATYEIAHGTNTRPTHTNTTFDAAKFEVCGHKFADLSEGMYGVSLINDCKYGYDIHDNRMRMTLLRSATCPDQTADKGSHSFSYRLYPHAGSWQESRLLEHAFSLNNPMRVYKLAANGNAGQTEKQYINISRKGVVLDAYKAAQDGDGIILRVYEALSSRGKVEITLPAAFNSVTECNLMEVDEQVVANGGSSFSFDIKPNEVRTFRIR